MSRDADPHAALIAKRRPIEDQLAAWMDEWAALCKSRGFDGEPFEVLKPIEQALWDRRTQAAAP